MRTNVFEIEEKINHRATDVVSPSNFRTREEGTADACRLVEDPRVTLFCLDDARREAVFVETAAGRDLTAFPFYYQAQMENAVRLFTLPYDDLHKLAAGVGDRFSNLILTYSVGRCGSTLLSRAFRRIGTVLDLSEPEVYLHIVGLRPGNGRRDAELRRLLQSCTRLLYKPSGSGDTLAIKFRSFSIAIADLMHDVYPEAKALFLYRNAESWARSQARAFDVFTPSAEQFLDRVLAENPDFLRRAMPLAAQYVRQYLRQRLRPRDYLALSALALAQRLPLLRGRAPTPAAYMKPQIHSYPRAKLTVLQWLQVMHTYLELDASGIPMLAVRYEDMQSAPRRVLEGIFAYCGLPAERLPEAEGAFAEDSQQGSTLARERLAGKKEAEFTAEHLAQLREVLSEHGTIRTADFRAPNTLAV
jgi:hypothetical protein